MSKTYERGEQAELIRAVTRGRESVQTAVRAWVVSCEVSWLVCATTAAAIELEIDVEGLVQAAADEDLSRSACVTYVETYRANSTVSPLAGPLLGRTTSGRICRCPCSRS